MFDENQMGLMSEQDTKEAFGPLLKLWNMQNQNAQLERQMAQAKALSQPRGQNYGSVAGNIAGGLGDIAGAIGGGIRQHQVGQQMQANTNAMQDPAIFSSPLAKQLLQAQLLGGQGMGGMQPQQPKPQASMGGGMMDLYGASNGMG